MSLKHRIDSVSRTCGTVKQCARQQVVSVQLVILNAQVYLWHPCYTVELTQRFYCYHRGCNHGSLTTCWVYYPQYQHGLVLNIKMRAGRNEKLPRTCNMGIYTVQYSRSHDKKHICYACYEVHHSQTWLPTIQTFQLHHGCQQLNLPPPPLVAISTETWLGQAKRSRFSWLHLCHNMAARLQGDFLESKLWP